MKKLDKYLIMSFVMPFFGILLIVVFILMMQFLWVYIDELVGKGLGLKVVLQLLMWGGASMLPLSIPLAALLTSVMTLGQMSENSELIAIKAAGISLRRVLAPLFVIAVLISIGAFFAANNLVPLAYNKIYTLRSDIGKTKEEINIPTGTFYDGIDGYILRIEDKDKATGMMYDVMVYDHTGNKGNSAMTLADSAIIKISKKKDYLIFNLYNGTNYSEDNSLRYRDTSLQLQKINFIEQKMIVPLENYAFTQSESAQFGDQTKAMNLEQLGQKIDSVTVLKDSAKIDNAFMFMRDGSLKYQYQIDTARNFKAAGMMDISKMGQWESAAAEKRAYQHAIQEVGNFKVNLTNNASDISSYKSTLHKAKTEFLKKFAGALACLIMFFIGAPLGAFVNKKSGLGAGIIIAVLFFVLYWVVDITGIKLARDGAAPEPVGVFVSTVVLLPIGLYLTSKAIHDSAVFRTENFGTWWRKAKSKIMSLFKKTKIVYMGTPEFAVAPLDALVKAGYNIAGVVTVADKPSGRGLKVNESAVKKYAVEHGIPVLQPLKLKDPEFLEKLAAWKADLFVVVAFRMLPEEVWKMPPLGTFNLHAALLPQYRGAAPINWAVINGERMTGVTTFMIDKNIDTGGIMLRQEVMIGPEETAGEVHDKLMPVGAQLVLETVQGIIERNIETRVQRSFIQGSEVLKPAPKLTRELCHIDWNDTTSRVFNLIRGLSPYPTAFTHLVKEGKTLQLKVFKASRFEGSIPEGTAPGTILSDNKSYLAVTTRDGALSLEDIQLEGKKRMDVAAFLAGFRDPASWSTSAGTSASEMDAASGR